MFSGISLRETTLLYSNAAPGGSTEYMYRIPSGAKAVYAILCGGGGGGGGGRSGAAGTNRGGGGGGANPPLLWAFIPTVKFPESLLILIGAGGVGGLPNSIGGAGGVSGIYYPTPFPARMPIAIIQGGGGGQAGSTTGAAGGGTWSPPTITPGVFGRILPLGANGSGGGAATGGLGGPSSISGNLLNRLSFSGAGGGGIGSSNVVFAGGRTATIFYNGIAATDPGANGEHGVSSHPKDFMYIPFVRNGGGGGASSDVGTGGRGGNGGLGAGGGGGGGGITGGTGGNGGNGFAMLMPVY